MSLKSQGLKKDNSASSEISQIREAYESELQKKVDKLNEMESVIQKFIGEYGDKEQELQETIQSSIKLQA